MTEQKTILDYLRIMVVEDEDHLRDVICDSIRHLGIRHVYQATDGQEALSLSEQLRPDMVFCDIQMEPMGGLEYLKRLRYSADSDFATTPVVFLTGTTDQETVMKAKELSVDGFIAKPPRGAAIRDAINRILNNPAQ
ncbi:MAG: response regulator [Pseudomonadota bacterium]